MDRGSGKVKLPDMGKLKYPLLVALAGIFLLVGAGGWGEKDGEQPQNTVVQLKSLADEREELELRMEEILSRMQGVGQVDVMLTVQSGKELVLAQDQTLRYSGVTHAPDDYERSGETVVLSGSGGGEDVMVTQERYPQYRGALVVCEGGGSDGVRLQVVAAVSALTGLGTDRIAVMKWEAGVPGAVKETEN